ncbi:T4SS guanine nucleotide exchange effector RalF [Legionella clemsonensis]|nr:T4SS guanine nucleotide exchange effector RalF [Legionella clemsonensis]
MQAAKEGRLDLKELNKLKIELEKPVRLSETLCIQIEDCHPSTGRYKRALPKGYQSDITAVNKAIQAQTENFITREVNGTTAQKFNKNLHKTIHLKNIGEEIHARRMKIIKAFNRKPKNGIQKIKEICAVCNVDAVEEHIADFFHKEKKNLDLEAVGDYLSGPDAENKAVLTAFTGKIDLTGQNFTQSLRRFLSAFKLPGEAQKIDRLVESFSEEYYKKNPGGNIANKDAGYILAFQTIMLNTDLHNPNIASNRKMDFNGLKRNLRGCNNGADFDEHFLQELYNDIKANPFEVNFIKIEPGYVIASSALNHDSTLNRLNSLLHSSIIEARHLFPGVGNTIKLTITQPKSWLTIFTGYEGTITLSNEHSTLASIQIYAPNFLSRWLFGKQPKVIIQPICKDGKAAPEAIELAAKIAASFETPVTSIKATYDYMKSDLQSRYAEKKKTAAQYELSPEKLQFLLKEGRFVVRGVRIQPGFKDLEDELKYLTTTRMNGTYKNVERNGQRGRCASLIVPGVKMELFTDIGVVYDADKSTIRAYMFHDGMTSISHGHDNFYNASKDKHKFEPFLSRQEFMEKYKEHCADPRFNHPRYTKYNEVNGNFFPESLIGLVGKNSNFDTKLKLYIAKYYLQNQHHLDLPMTLMVGGKVRIWKPDRSEIVGLLKIANKTKLNRSDFKLFEALANDIGYSWQYNGSLSQHTSGLHLFKTTTDVKSGKKSDEVEVPQPKSTVRLRRV